MEGPREAPRRTVYCEDALAWLRARPKLDGCSVITSLPDASELPSLSPEAWERWFEDAAALVLSRCPDEGVAIFFQSDVKRDGRWVDKGRLVQRAAEREGVPLLFHQIVCRVRPGSPTHGRAGYSHLLCFSRGARYDLQYATADVLPEAGETTWTRGMGARACESACRFVLRHTPTRTVVDPFCGHGTALAVANSMGLDAIGVEIVRKRAQRARSLHVAETYK
ncbi:MAG TPA: SAM-dependent methyltransferase [Myxococcaceae bacterium]|nr:SAM-dependent methyltransferase [Myxococcaceae bacterium]